MTLHAQLRAIAPKATRALQPANACLPKGWHAVALQCAAALEQIPGAQLVQLKTKWGHARVYVEGPPEAHDRATLTERALDATCMTCGAHLIGDTRAVRRQPEPWGCTSCVR